MTLTLDGRRVGFTTHARERFAARCGGDLTAWAHAARLRRKRPRWLPPVPAEVVVLSRLDGENLNSHFLVGEGGAFPLTRDRDGSGVLVATTFLPKGGTRHNAARRRAVRDYAGARL